MSVADTPALLEEARRGDNDACARLIEENAGLIWSIVRRYYGRGTDPEDLYQLGCLGFLKAVRGFDPAFGCHVYKQLRPIKRQNHIFRHFSLLRFVGNPAAFSIRDYEKIINVENEQKRGRFLGTDTFIMLHRKKSFRRHSSHATSHGNTVQRPFPPQMASRSYSMAINHITGQVVCTQTSLYVALFCIG